MNLDAIFEAAATKAAADFQKQAEKKAERQANSRKSRIADWKKRQAVSRAAAREEKTKTGTEIAETFIQEVSAQFIRLMGRDDAPQMEGLKIVFVPGKSDHAATFSALVQDGSKKLKTFYKASLQQLAEREERLLNKLRQETGFTASSPIEMMEKIAEQKKQLNALNKKEADRQTVLDAAQDVVLAWVDGQDLEPELKKLEESFLQ